MPGQSDNRPIKGRGAVSNGDGRFEGYTREAVDDGWSAAAPDHRRRTTVAPDHARRVISRNDSPDIPFEQSVNPYRGCEHGCIYCYARPSHAYLGLSPGLDFETRLFAKRDAPRLLAEELARPGYRCRPICLGANTDPYQPVERSQRITRGLLEVIDRHRQPAVIVTKSTLVLRDLDLLADMARRRLVAVFLSVTTLDPELSRRLEPRAAAPQRRIDAMRLLAEAGVPVGVLVAPIIPALTDVHLEAVLAAAADAGAERAGYVLLRLPREVHDLFREWLAVHVPGCAAHVMSLVRQSRGGRYNDPEFGSRMRGTGVFADVLARRFRVQCRRLGLADDRPALDVSSFRPPADDCQLALF